MIVLRALIMSRGVILTYIIHRHRVFHISGESAVVPQIHHLILERLLLLGGLSAFEADNHIRLSAQVVYFCTRLIRHKSVAISRISHIIFYYFLSGILRYICAGVSA